MEFLISSENLPDIFSYSSHYGYIGIFLFFITVDQLTPLPEEITLLTIGYLASNHVFNPIIAGTASVAAFLTVDFVYFFLARCGNKFIKKMLVRKENSFVDKYKKRLNDNLGISILALCFIPRMRLFCPIFVGLMNLSIKKFLLFDTLGLALFTAIYISIGMFFHSRLHSHMAELETLQHIIFGTAMLILGIIIIVFIRRYQQKK